MQFFFQECGTSDLVYSKHVLMQFYRFFIGDWHRYNLKRKVANLPIVSAADFEARKDAHETQAKVNITSSPRSIDAFCRILYTW